MAADMQAGRGCGPDAVTPVGETLTLSGLGHPASVDRRLLRRHGLEERYERPVADHPAVAKVDPVGDVGFRDADEPGGQGLRTRSSR